MTDWLTRLKSGAVGTEEYWSEDVFPAGFRTSPEPSPLEAAALLFVSEVHDQLWGQGAVLLHADRLQGSMLAGTTHRANGDHVLLLGREFDDLDPTVQAATLVHEALHMLHARYRWVIDSELTLAGLRPRARHRVMRAILMEEERVLAVLEPFMTRALTAVRRWRQASSGAG